MSPRLGAQRKALLQSGLVTVYLDHAATTPMLPVALATMTERLAQVGNPSSLHTTGRDARRVVEESREQLAAALGAAVQDVRFTSGGTESDNLAVKGIYWARREADPRRTRILVGAVEHHAVLDPALWLAQHEGAELVTLPVDRAGRIDLAAAADLIDQAPERTALISVMWANNEVGTIQPVDDLLALAAEHDIPLHTDAVQAFGTVGVDVAATPVGALTMTGHKIGGPVGTGVLVLRRGLACEALLHGGGQEQGLRSGTLNVPGIAALATAAAHVVASRPADAQRLAGLRDRLLAGLRREVPAVVVNGADAAGPDRIASNLHVTFPGCEGDSLLYLLDAAQIACSTGSACNAGVPRPSHVLTAMGIDDDLARGSLRFSFGHTSTGADVDAVLAVIGDVVERARNAGLAALGPAAARRTDPARLTA